VLNKCELIKINSEKINRKMFTDEEKNERLSNFIDFIQDV